jgi:sulfur carrier protein
MTLLPFFAPGSGQIRRCPVRSIRLLGGRGATSSPALQSLTGRAGHFYNAGARQFFQTRWWRLSVEITVNGTPREAPAGGSIASLLAELDLDSRQVAVEVNLELVPRSRHAEHRLQAGDEVEVVTLVGGG